LTDQIDSVSVVTDDNGKVVTRTEYLPYGETWIQEGEARNRPKFNSQELDAETNFYFYNARYYDPEICRFVTADNVIDGEYDTQGWNRFAYCRGNPIAYKDPTGHEVSGEIVGGIIGAPFGSAGSKLGAYWGSKIQDYFTGKDSKENVTDNNVQSQSINKAPDGGAVPGRINGPKQSNEVIRKLSEDVGQDNGKGNAILREMFGNDFERNAYCQTNSTFLALAKLGCVEPTVDGYKKFIQYASSKECPWNKNLKCVDRANGQGNDLWEIAKDYGANYESARNDGDKAREMYENFLSDGDDNQVALVHNGEHCVASSPIGGDKDYAYDTGEGNVRGKTQYDRTRYSIDEGRKIYNTIIMTKK
jgi:RHS repeat-associated protein